MNTAILTRSNSLVGTAIPANTFILLEVPLPWAKPALLSTGVPESLRQVIRPLLVSQSGVRVHLIANEESARQSRRRMLIFQRDSNGEPGEINDLVNEYKFCELQVESSEAMAPALDAFFKHNSSPLTISSQRHLMVCTHASHNECCGIYGYPFYQDAIATVQQLGLSEEIKVWQISHIGGHRYAPTLIDFPHGRYYGNLDQLSLTCLLQQKGDIEPLLSTYRGWSMLPKALQSLEADLWQHHGWSWLQGSVFGRILKQTTAYTLAELMVKLPEQQLLRYIAEIQDEQSNYYQLTPLA